MFGIQLIWEVGRPEQMLIAVEYFLVILRYSRKQFKVSFKLKNVEVLTNLI